MIACIDGGLICVGLPLLLSLLGVGGWIKARKWCRKACDCQCHDKPKHNRVWDGLDNL